MSNYSGQIINALLSSEKNQIHIVAGFDAAIDSLVKPVRNRNADGTKEYFKTIADFGEFLTEKHNLSCMIEVDTVMEKSGGNMVNFSHAIGELGGLVDCIGSLGVTKTHPMFEHLSTNCTLHGAADPGECMALEFSDGKVMLSRMDKANELSMENVQKKIGIADLTAMLNRADVTALLNWSEMLNSTEIWLQFVRILAKSPDREKYALIDLTDCSRRETDEVKKILEIVRMIPSCRKTVFSVNQNEAKYLAGLLGCEESSDIQILGRSLFKELRIDILVIHLHKEAYMITDDNIFYHRGIFISNPKISTGAGDNYNAAMMMGLANGMPLDDVLFVANMQSAFYVKNGYSPKLSELAAFIRETDSLDKKDREKEEK